MTISEEVKDIILFACNNWEHVLRTEDNMYDKEVADEILEIFNKRLPKEKEGCDGGKGKFKCCGRCFGAHYYNLCLAEIRKGLE
jgi:hypothetical protein